MSVALVTIATGEAYRQYARGLHRTALDYFPTAKFVLFSDHDRNPGVDLWFHTPPKGFPDETLYRYHTMLKQAQALSQFSQIFHLDADMEFVAPVGPISSYGIVATLHPGYLGHTGPTESRPQSWAYARGNVAYYCGGFQGGSTPTYLAAAQRIAKGVDQDYRNGITALWHDESHWNRYLRDYPPAKVLSPSYCYHEGYHGQYGWEPEDYPPILMALDKNKRGKYSA